MHCNTNETKAMRRFCEILFLFVSSRVKSKASEGYGRRRVSKRKRKRGGDKRGTFWGSFAQTPPKIVLNDAVLAVKLVK